MLLVGVASIHLERLQAVVLDFDDVFLVVDQE
jgi:hypothetical protein